MRIKRGRAFFNGLLQQPVNVDGVRRQITRQSRRFTQLFLVAAILHHMHKRGDGAFRRAVGWQPGLAEQAPRLLRGKLTAPVGEQGNVFTSRMVAHGVNERARAFTARRDRAGGVDNHQRVEILAIQQNGDRPDVAVAAGVIAQIKRIAGRHAGRKRFFQALQRLFTQRCQLAEAPPQLVQRERGRGRTVTDNH